MKPKGIHQWMGAVPVFVVGLLLVMGCSADTENAMEPPNGPIVENTLWERVVGDADPFAESGPMSDDCVDDAGYLAELFGEDLVFSVSTEFCPALTVEQPLLLDIPRGTWLEGRIWHFQLNSEAPAAGWVALAVEGRVVWSHTLAIPAESGLVLVRWQAPRDLYAGEAIQFHVQNHGKNSWHLIDLVAGDPSL